MEPKEPANKGLVLVEKSVGSRFGGLGNAVDGKAGPVRGGHRIAFKHPVGSENLFGLGCLGDTDGQTTVRETLPLVLASEEPTNRSHEVNADAASKGLFEKGFGFVGGTEVFKVVDVDPKVDRGEVGTHAPHENTWIVFAL